MRTVGVVVVREFLQRVRTRAFLISTIGAPVILMGILVVPAWFSAREATAEFKIALVDRTGVLAQGLQPRLEAMGFQVEVVQPGSPEEDGLRQRLEEELRGAVFLDTGTLERGSALWVGSEAPSALRRVGLREGVARTALEVRLRATGEADAVGALLAGGALEVETLEPVEAEATRLAGMAVGFVGAFFLYMVIILYGSMVLRAVLEEKTGRIVEIIVSSMRPWELMLGKVLGVGAVGLFQLAIWSGAGLLIVGLAAPYLLGLLAAETRLVEQFQGFMPGPGVITFFVICFVVGYFLYASLFAAVGAMCASEEDAQQLQFPVVILVVFPVVLLMPTMENPDTGWAVAASLFPFFSPILMFARVAAGAAALWEVGLSIVLMLGALWGSAWVAGRIYRVGILMQGKRPTIPELWRWIRQR
jgi:ABC-2 type transport system permease protein